MDFSQIGVSEFLLSLTGYVTIWVFCLFFTLPLFHEQQNASERTVEEIGAPRRHYMKRKLILTSILAFVFWAALHIWLLREGFYFWDWVNQF